MKTLELRLPFSILLKGVSFMKFRAFFLCLLAFVVCGCEDMKSIVSSVDERDANVIVVFLDSKGIPAIKEASSSGPGVGGEGPAAPKFDILVPADQAIDAMAILNRNGLPRRQGTNLLELFAKQGLMSTDKEETIRYQAGLAQQIANMILMIDGVIDANVQISFPSQEPGAESSTPQKITAAVFVKHQGIIDDPNSHLENKIKRLVSGSINGLDINDVTVVSDKSRFTDISMGAMGMPSENASQEYVKVWSMMMNKDSVGTFRVIFFFLLVLTIALGAVAGWVLWKIYPVLKSKGGWKELINPDPLLSLMKKKETPAE